MTHFGKAFQILCIFFFVQVWRGFNGNIYFQPIQLNNLSETSPTANTNQHNSNTNYESNDQKSRETDHTETTHELLRAHQQQYHQQHHHQNTKQIRRQLLKSSSLKYTINELNKSAKHDAPKLNSSIFLTSSSIDGDSVAGGSRLVPPPPPPSSDTHLHRSKHSNSNSSSHSTEPPHPPPQQSTSQTHLNQSATPSIIEVSIVNHHSNQIFLDIEDTMSHSTISNANLKKLIHSRNNKLPPPNSPTNLSNNYSSHYQINHNNSIHNNNNNNYNNFNIHYNNNNINNSNCNLRDSRNNAYNAEMGNCALKIPLIIIYKLYRVFFKLKGRNSTLPRIHISTH